jgi:3-dehydroquinate dehydratase-2
LVNGPNLNLLGKREPEIYGRATLSDVEDRIVGFAAQFNANVTAFQSNCEGKIIQRIHEAMGNVDFIIINPGGLTHTSVALRDALLGVGIPFHEVHLSNIHARESFRHHSYISDKAQGVIRGFGVDGYELAVMSAFKTLEGECNLSSVTVSPLT